MGEQLAERIREELGRRRVTRQWLADEARISLSTLEKGLAGQRRFTLATIVRIEGVLGLSLRPAAGVRDGRPKSRRTSWAPMPGRRCAGWKAIT